MSEGCRRLPLDHLRQPKDSYWLTTARRDCPLWVDSVEKVGLPKTLEY